MTPMSDSADVQRQKERERRRGMEGTSLKGMKCLPFLSLFWFKQCNRLVRLLERVLNHCRRWMRWHLKEPAIAPVNRSKESVVRKGEGEKRGGGKRGRKRK